MTLTAVASVAGVLAAPASQAGTARSYYDYDGGAPGRFTGYFAEPGETNRVIVYAGLGGALFEDPGAPVMADPPCEQRGPNAAWCPGTIDGDHFG